MSKILFVVDKYWPEPNAITFCLDKIIDHAIKNGHKVLVFTTKNRKNDAFFTETEKVGVFRTKNRKYLIESYYQRHINKNTPAHLIGGVAHKILSLRCGKYDENYRRFFDNTRANNDLSEVILREKPDAVVSVSFPFSAHRLVKNAENTYAFPRWIAYELDPYSFRQGFSEKHREERMKTEHDVLSGADGVIMLNGIDAENIRRGFLCDIRQKISTITLPNFTAEGGYDSVPVSGDLRLLHTGNAYSSEYFDFLDAAAQTLGIRVLCEMCGFGSEKYVVNKENLRVTAEGFVSDEKKRQMTNGCNALLLLGDPRSNQFPSKLAYYVSTGKPILHIRCSQNDPCLEILEKYGNYCSIDVSEDVRSAAREIGRFVEEISSKENVLEKEEIERRLKGYLSEEVCERMLDLILGKVPEGAANAAE